MERKPDILGATPASTQAAALRPSAVPYPSGAGKARVTHASDPCVAFCRHWTAEAASSTHPFQP